MQIAKIGETKFLPIVLGTDINAYGVVRSFYSAYQVESVILGKRELAFCNPCNHSKLIQKIVIDSKIDNDEIFIKRLAEIKKNVDKDVKIILIPCGDSYSELVSRNQKTLKKDFVFLTVNYQLFEELSGKDSFYKLCEKYNLPYPKTLLINQENYQKCDQLGFPIIIKPSNPVEYAKTGYVDVKKVYLAQTMDELDRIIEEIYNSSYKEELIVQEYIDGDDDLEAEVHAYSDKNGKVKFMQFNQAILELPTPGGLGSYAATTSTKNEKVLEQIKDFLEAINYTGFSNFDLKFDKRDQKYKFFEINIRLSRSSFSATAAGYNFAKFIVEDLLLNKELDLVIADKEVFYSIVPYKTVMNYCNNQELKSKITQLKENGEYYGSFWDDNDNSLMRRLTYWRDQNSWAQKFKKYFNIRRKI